jgi:hypothetical protein
MKIAKRIRKKINSNGNIPCDICNEPHILEEHHINGRKIANCNHPSNLCAICSNCHTEVHYGKIIIERWAMTTMGKKLLWHYQNEESITGEKSNPHLIS